jgi:hypothetical protein
MAITFGNDVIMGVFRLKLPTSKILQSSLGQKREGRGTYSDDTPDKDF